MRSDSNIKSKSEKITMQNSQPIKIIRDKLKKQIKKRSGLKNIDLKRKRTKFDTKNKKQL
jgi:hypothetical protein